MLLQQLDSFLSRPTFARCPSTRLLRREHPTPPISGSFTVSAYSNPKIGRFFVNNSFKSNWLLEMTSEMSPRTHLVSIFPYKIPPSISITTVFQLAYVTRLSLVYRQLLVIALIILYLLFQRTKAAPQSLPCTTFHCTPMRKRLPSTWSWRFPGGRTPRWK